MNVFNREDKLIGYISVHVKYLIFNNKSKNILYEFIEYEKLLRDLNIEYNVDTSNVLQYICWNCKIVDDIVLNKKKKSKKENVVNIQLNLFR